MHASSMIASALHGRFCKHLISIVDIQLSSSTSVSCMHTSHVVASALCSCYTILSWSRSSKCIPIISFAQSYSNSRSLIHS